MAVTTPYDAMGASAARGQYVSSVLASLSGEAHLRTSIAAIILQLSITALLAVVISVDIFMDNWTVPGSSTTVIYITFVTILATLVTSFTTSAIRSVWFSHTVTLSTKSGPAVTSRIKVLVGLGSVKDQFKGWQVSVIFLLAGLLTTSIVAGLTPRSIVYVSPAAEGGIYMNDYSPCMNDYFTDTVLSDWFSWTLPNNSTLGLSAIFRVSVPACEVGVAMDYVLTAVPDGRPKGLAYIMRDVQIAQGAAGLPWGINSLDGVFGINRTRNFQWASRCLPVLHRNPVRCTRRGQVAIEDSGQISVSSGDCKIIARNLQIHLPDNPAAVLGACTKNHSLGTATILLGAINGRPDGTTDGLPNIKYGRYAYELAQSMNENVLEVIPKGQSTYAVTCEVDIASSVSFRMLNYSRSDNLGARDTIGYGTSMKTVDSGYAYQVQPIGNSTCSLLDNSHQPVSMGQVLNNTVLGIGASATWPLLSQNLHYDGAFDTLGRIIGRVASQNASKGNGAFRDSTSDLEDALGLTTAITMSIFWGGNIAPPEANLDKGTQAYTRTRLGPSNALGYIYLLPSLTSVFILIYFVWRSWGVNRSARKD